MSTAGRTSTAPQLVDLLRRFGGQPTIEQLRGDLFRLAGGTAA